MAPFLSPEYEALDKTILYPQDPATDKQLAVALCYAESDGDVEDVVLATDAILKRIGIPLDESEQGLTPRAAAAVDAFVGEHFTS